MAKYPTLQQLKKSLGSEYQIVYFDLEKCLYRKFDNDFDVEISGLSHANRSGPTTLYLWYSKVPGGWVMVKTMKGVGRDADSIAAAVDKLYGLSERLIAAGYNDRDSLRGILGRLRTDEDFP